MNWQSYCWILTKQVKRSVRLQVTDPQINRRAQALMYSKVTAQFSSAVHDANSRYLHNCAQSQLPQRLLAFSAGDVEAVGPKTSHTSHAGTHWVMFY